MNKSLSLAIVIIILLVLSCDKTKVQEYSYTGKTMGTYYSIKYLSEKEVVDLTLIEHKLMLINNSMSTYIDDSKISMLNKAKKDEKVFVDDWMIGCLSKSIDIHENTGRAFDPSIGPIVNYWGFGKIKEAPRAIDSLAIDSLLKFKGLDQFKTGVNPKASNNDDKVFMTKTNGNAQLDFSALAKGLGVDIIFNMIMEKGVENLLVDIGGELRALGKNELGEVWQVGIDKPLKDKNDNRELKAIIPLENRAIATSGNYRNYQMINNQKMGHIINPTNGFPEYSDLLSVSVLASDCMTADAYATAFMVMGWERAGIMVENTDNMEAYFIVSKENGELKTMVSSGLKEIIKE